ncbi:MAG: hypothetical protein ACP5MK_00345 [Candidatus Micrarchaeia archaeon]
MDEETTLYIAVTSMVALFVLFVIRTFGPLELVVAIFAILTILAILIMNFADFIIFTAFTYIFGISIVPAKNYVIPKIQNAVLKNINGLYYATGYLTANIYNYAFMQEQADESEDMKLAAAPDNWERIVMNIHFPFKFNIITAAQDIQTYRDELEGKRGFYEYQMSKEESSGNPSQMTIDDLQRKINVLKARIDRLSAGERPVKSIMYIETTAVGVSEKAAMDALNAQINQLQTVFNAMDVSIVRVSGRELYLLFKFGYILIPDMMQIEKLFHSQK